MTILRLALSRRGGNVASAVVAGAGLLASAGFVILAGCSVGPAYHRPQVPTPSQWRTPVTPAQALWPDADWWHRFGSATLDRYVGEALASGDDVAAAIARVREADAQARIAGAPLFPAVAASGEALRERQFSPGGQPVTYNEYTPTLTASYELDFWGKNRATHQAAVLAALASRFDRQTVVLSVIAGVAQDYFEALENHDLLQVAQTNLATAQHVLDGLQLEEEVGTATALDVAQQASVVAAENAAIPPLVQQLHQSLDALATLLGVTPESLALPDAGLATLTAPPVIGGLPSILLERRPDVAEAEANLHAANANITVARAAYFPDVDLTASGGFASSMLSNLITPAARVFELTGTITQNIFQGGALRGQVQYSEARYTELLADYHKAVISALSNVEDALIAVQQSSEQQRRQQDAADKAQQAFDFAQQQMTAGTTNILTVLNTETTLLTAQNELVQVKYQHLEALVQLYQALGGGWQQSQERL